MLINGFDLNVEDQGAGTPVLLLHGWPASSDRWRHQIPALTSAGFRTITPDMRGFGGSEGPTDVAGYSIGRLRSDVVAIMDELEIESAHIVGHDWGAALAWTMAIFEPSRVKRLVTMAAPHPAVPNTIEQREKFWYMLHFQFAGVAEAQIQAADWIFFREMMRDDGDIDRYITDLARPGALTRSLNIYRANAAPTPPHPPAAFPPITAPTLVISGDGDNYLVADRVAASTEFVSGESRYENIADSSHWVPVDQPGRLNELLLEWLL